MDGTLAFKFFECPLTEERVRVGKCKRSCEHFRTCPQVQEIIKEYNETRGNNQ